MSPSSGHRRIFATAQPMTRFGPVLPMTREDAEFWRLLHERRRDREATR